MVKVSIIVPVYNVANYLEKCLDSLINQTLEDIEIICINDGSTDNSLNILEKYAEKSNKIRVFTFNNKGLGASRNRGIKLASGEYITFVDSDDWVELNFCEKAYNNAKHNDSDIVLCNAIEEYGDSQKKRIYFSEKEVPNPEEFTFNYTSKKDKVLNNYLTAWSKLHRTSFLLENNIKFPNIIFEDGPFQVETFIKAKKISYCPDIFYHYRKNNSESIMANLENKKAFYVFDNINFIENILKEQDVYEEFKIEFLRYKLTQIKQRFNFSNEEIGDKFFIKTKKYLLNSEISINDLEKLPLHLTNFYFNILNSYSYNNFKKFQKGIKKHGNYINKKVLDEKVKEFEELGINKEKREEKFIVSLTSFPERMHDIHYCLYSLLNQNFKPDKLLLWLAEEEFPNKEEDIPKEVLNLKKNGLTIKWCNNLKSYKKLIPALKEYPNDIIITADDDIYYPKNWLKDLYEEHLEYPDCIISKRCRKIKIDYGEIQSYNEWKLFNKKTSPSYLNFSTNGGGSLFPPNSLNKSILEEDLFKKLCPSADDIWIWSMAILNKTKIKGSKRPIPNLKYINIARELGLLNHKTLWETNKKGANDIQFNNIITHYPEILKIINEEIEEN